MKNLLMVTTGGGYSYAERIFKSIMFLSPDANVEIVPYNRIKLFPGFEPENTVIYMRAAHPSPHGWMGKLIELEDRGYVIINSTNCLLTTSNKSRCAQLLQNNIPHPKTWIVDKQVLTWEYIYDIFHEDASIFKYVVKPQTSKSQGANVRLIDYDDGIDSALRTIEEVLGNLVVLQEYVPYIALHRVIVFNGISLPYTFVDKPEWHANGDWKVSVCLNKTTMQYNEYGDKELLDMAVKAQKIVGGEINFIDIFETLDGYVMNEINTACNLHIHEQLARVAGESNWNIHRMIAKYLLERVKELS